MLSVCSGPGSGEAVASGGCPPLFCAHRTPTKPRQSGHLEIFLRSRLSGLSKYLEITETTETTETTGADLRKRQSSQSSQSSQWSHALALPRENLAATGHALSPTPERFPPRKPGKCAKGIGTTKGMRTRRTRVLVRPTRGGGLRLPWSRPVVSVVSVDSVDSVSAEMTGLLPRRKARFVRVAVRDVGLP